METKHTPGPWFAQCDFLDNGFPYATITAEKDSSFRGGRYLNVSGCIDEHDARLIAAAPVMLEALKLGAEVFRTYEQIHTVKGSQDKAERNRNYAECFEAIIAKATGGAQ